MCKTIAIIALLTLFVIAGCAPKPTLGIYLTEHKSFRDVSENPYGVRAVAIDLATVKLAETPIISAEDILGYDWNTHTLTVKPGIGKKLPSPDSFGIPFAMVADGERCYIGGIWTGVSSVASPRPVIMISDAANDTFTIRLGYPSPMHAKGHPDTRNAPRVKSALTALGKLRPIQPDTTPIQ